MTTPPDALSPQDDGFEAMAVELEKRAAEIRAKLWEVATFDETFDRATGEHIYKLVLKARIR